MNIKRMRNLAIETFKTINHLHKEIFTINMNRRIWSNKIIIENHNTAIYGKKIPHNNRSKSMEFSPQKT